MEAPNGTPVGAEPGQSAEISYDPFGRLVTLDAGAASGYFYTTPITPSSFSAWGRVYVDFTSATLGGVTIKVYNAVTGADLGSLDLTAPSDDPAYAKMAELSRCPRSSAPA